MAGKNVKVVILGDASNAAAAFNQLSQDASGAESKLVGIGKKMSSVGATMTKSVTLPLVAIGSGALMAAQQYDDASDTIRAGTGATGEALNDLNDSFQKVFTTVPASSADAAKAIADLNTRTGLTGEALEGMASQVLNLARLTGEDLGGVIAGTTRVFGDWSIATEDQAGALDYLWKVSQTTGIGVTQLTDKVVQFGAPLRQLGFDFETSAAMMGKWEKEGVNIELALGGMKRALGKFAKAGEDPVKALQSISDQIANAGTQAEANALAIEVFGQRAGPDMAAAIREGRFDLDELLATLESSGETINTAASDTMSLNEKLTLLKNKAIDAAVPLGEALLGALDRLWPTLESVIAVVSGAVQWFGNLPGPVQNVVLGVAALAAAVGPLLSVVGPLLAALPALGVAFAAISGPIGIAIAAVAALIAVGVLVYKNWDEIKAFAASTWTAIKDTLSTVWNAIKDKFTEVWDAISSYATATWDAIKAEAERIWNAIKSVTEAIWNGIKEFFLTWWDGVKGLFTGEFGRMETLNETMWNAIKSAAVAIWNALKSALSGVWDEIKSAFQGLWSACKGAWDSAAEWIGDIPNKIKGFFAGAASWLSAIGRSIMDGLLSGIKSAWNSVADFLSGLGAKIKALKGPIQEDRKLLIPEGKAIMESLGIGMDTGWRDVQSRLQKYARDIKAWGYTMQDVYDYVTAKTGITFGGAFSGSGGAGSMTPGGQSAWEASLAADNMAKYGQAEGRYTTAQKAEWKAYQNVRRYGSANPTSAQIHSAIDAGLGGGPASSGPKVVNINVQGMGQMDTVRAIAGALATV